MKADTASWLAAQDKTPYEEGRQAKRDGRGWFACPYSDPLRREAWFRGFDDQPRHQEPS